MTTLTPLTCGLRAASDATGLSVRQLYRFIEQNRLKTSKVDKRRLIHVDSLRQLVATSGAQPRRTAQ